MRLDELNAKAEDSALWNDPKEAEKVMRERTKLEGAISNIKRLRAAVDDNTGLIEMAEAENVNSTWLNRGFALPDGGDEGIIGKADDDDVIEGALGVGTGEKRGGVFNFRGMILRHQFQQRLTGDGGGD